MLTEPISYNTVASEGFTIAIALAQDNDRALIPVEVLMTLPRITGQPLSESSPASTALTGAAASQ